MAGIKVFYTIESSHLQSVLDGIDAAFGLKPSYDENYVSMRGSEDSGIETVRMSLEGNIVKIMVVLCDDSFIEGFSRIIGTPTKIKGRRSGTLPE
jgi:hypothetical protein